MNETQLFYDSYLAHHGIKGMRWGVRRYQNTDGSLTPAGKKRYNYDIQTDEGQMTIPKGSKMYRVSVNKSQKYSGPVYVTYTDVDRDLYKGSWSTAIAKNQSGDARHKVYEQEFTVNNDLKIPSHTTVKKVEQQLKKDPNVLREVGEAWATQYLKTNNKQLSAMKDIVDKHKDSPMYDYADKFIKAHEKVSLQMTDTYKKAKDEGSLYRFSASIGVSDYTKAAVIRELSKQGYNAMTDEFGVGGGSTKEQYVKEGVQPLIIFDGANISQIKTHKLSIDERKAADARYMNWYKEQNRR